MSIEVNTYSAAVDLVISRSKRADRRSDIISYVRTTVRELQATGLYENDLVEDQLSNINTDPYVWDAPINLRQMVTVSYPSIVDQQGNPIHPRYIGVGKRQLRYDYFYYRSGSSYVFAGHQGTSASPTLINVAYLEYTTLMNYFGSTTARPARYMLDEDLGTSAWEYADSVAPTDAAELAARQLVTNWILFNWFDVVVEGALAKLYKTTQDERAVSTFALFKSLQTTFHQGEQQAAMGGDR